MPVTYPDEKTFYHEFFQVAKGTEEVLRDSGDPSAVGYPIFHLTFGPSVRNLTLGAYCSFPVMALDWKLGTQRL